MAGNPAQPQGTIEFLEVTGGVTTHSNFLCDIDGPKPPKKYDNTFCLHVATPERTYNLRGFESKEILEKWMQTVQFAVRSYHVVKQAKRWLREINVEDLNSDDFF